MRNLKSRLITENAERVLVLFDNHHLKMVLQGHTHVYMNLLVDDIYYISGGSTFYSPDRHPSDDGFISVRINDNKEEIKFIPTRSP